MDYDPDSLGRRQYLALAGLASVGAVAGCSSEDDGSDDGNGDNSNNNDDGSTDETDTDQSDSTDDSNNSDENDDSDNNDDEDEPSPASFDLTVSPLPTVEVGEEVTVDAAVENTGEQEDTQTVEITLDGDTVSSQSITLGPGDRDSISPTVNAPDDPDDYDVTVTTDNDEVTVTLTVEAGAADIEPQTFSGTGQEVRQDIQINGGLTVVEATYSGESNFQVSLEGGEFPTNFVNVIGDFDGAQAELVEEGTYILEINADGPWEVTLRQPRATSGESLPVSSSGSNPDVVGPVEFSGTGVATGSHDGDSNFQVQILPAEGQFGENVFNEIGEFDGETAYNFDGIGWVDINANGNWSLELE
jgi:hypothetical protein